MDLIGPFFSLLLIMVTSTIVYLIGSNYCQGKLNLGQTAELNIYYWEDRVWTAFIWYWKNWLLLLTVFSRVRPFLSPIYHGKWYPKREREDNLKYLRYWTMENCLHKDFVWEFLTKIALITGRLYRHNLVMNSWKNCLILNSPCLPTVFFNLALTTQHY